MTHKRFTLEPAPEGFLIMCDTEMCNWKRDAMPLANARGYARCHFIETGGGNNKQPTVHLPAKVSVS